MFKRVKEAMSDVAETLRRTFGGVEVGGGDLRFPGPETGGFVSLKVGAVPGLESLIAIASDRGWRLTAIQQVPEMVFHPRLEQEAGWEAWASRSQAVPVPLFTPGRAGRMEVPALPRRASPRRAMTEAFRVSLRTIREPLRSPGTRQAPLKAATPSTRQAPLRTPSPHTRKDLSRVLRRPFSFLGQAFASLPKALQMRYTMQLVKSTGENIRDLEVVGLFRVPRKGLGALRLDPRNGGLLASLTAEAVGAPKDLLLLAKRKADQALLPCFLEAN